MAACNQTDIPVLNIQEDPCIQGSLITSCIFYGLAIDYLGSQSSSSFFDVLGLIVAKLEAGNIDATTLEEDNRAQALTIEALQNSIAESLVTLSEVQVLLDECCPEPTTTVAPTTTITPTTSTTTQNYVGSMYVTTGPDEYTACNSMIGVTLYWSGIAGPEGKRMYQNPELTIPWNDFTYAVNSTNVYSIANGFASLQGVCSDFNTTTTTTGVGPTINPNYSSAACDTSGGFQTVTLMNGTSICDTNVYLSSSFIMLPTQFYITYQGVSRLFQKDSQNQFAYPQGSCIDCSTTTTTTTSVNSYNYTVSASSSSDRNYTCSNPFTSGQQTLWASTYIPGDVQKFYTDSNLTNPYIGNVNDYYAYMIGWPSGILYIGQMGSDGTMFNKSVCEEPTTTTSTTTAAPTTGASVPIWFGPTSANACNQNYYNISVMLNGGATSICDANNIYANFTPYGVANTTIYTKQSSSSLVRSFFVDASGTFATQTGICENCTTTTTVAPTTTTTTTTSTTTIAPGEANFSIIGENPRAIIMDAQGNVYTANSNSDDITKITLSGAVSILGSTGRNPTDLVMDSSGNIYTANFQGNSITKVTPEGVSTQFATLGFVSPQAIAIDSLGNLYTANSQTNNVSKITPSGNVSILGTAGTFPYGIVVDSQDNIYVSNFSSSNVTKITPLGVSTVLGNTGIGPREIAIDAQGNIYTANSSSNTVTKITPAGVSTTLGNTGSFPIGITIDSSGNVYTANINGNSVTRITPSGEATSFSSNGVFPDDLVTGFGYLFVTNASGSTVSRIPLSTTTTTTTVAPGTLGFLGNFGDGPDQILFDTVGNTYLNVQNIDEVIKLNPAFTSSNFFTDNNAFYSFVIDSNNNIFALSTSEENAIKKITPSGQVSTFINSLTNGLGKRMTIDSLDNIFVTNTDTTVKKITPSGIVSSFGSVSTAPYGVITDSQNNLYVAELMDKTISKFTPSGTKTTVATLADNPIHFAVDSSDNLYTSCSNGTIFKTTPSGITTTLAIVQRADDITIDTIGNVYVTDVISDKIYKVTPSGTVTDFYSIANLKSVLEIQSEYLYFGLFTGNTYRIKL